MKQSFFKIFILLAVLTSSCISRPNPSRHWFESDGKIKILSTTAMINDLVAEIGKEKVDTIPLIYGQLDPHTYELVKGDDEKFAFADLIFYNGLGLEHGLSLRLHLENNPKAISLGEPLLKEDPGLILIVNGQYDPHIWMDIALWMRTVKTIVETLSKIDPQNADNYYKNGQNLLAKMEKADQEAYKKMQHIPDDKRFLVTSHDAFNYFARHYLAAPNEKTPTQWGIRFDAPEGLAPDAQLSVTDIQAIIAHIKKYEIKVVFPESNVSKDSLRKILDASKEQGIPLRISTEVLYGDAMGEPGSQADTYISMIMHNINVISKELDS